MSTNFYALGHRYDDDPAYHVGKRVSREFIQAMPDERFRELSIKIEPHCETCNCDAGKARFEDEYGNRLTAIEMFGAMIATGSVDTSQMGQAFS